MNTNSKTLRLSRLALFAALILLLNYTPLGYIHLFALEITLIVIPVTVGAMLLGPADGAVLGGIFGLTSFATCFGSSQFGAMLLSINPIATFITCVVARVLAGFLTGVVFQALHRFERTRGLSYAIGGLLGPVFNTLFFMGSILLFFWNTDYIQAMAAGMGTANPLVFVALFVGINAVFETAVSFLVSAALCRVLYPILNKGAGHPHAAQAA